MNMKTDDDTYDLSEDLKNFTKSLQPLGKIEMKSEDIIKSASISAGLHLDRLAELEVFRGIYQGESYDDYRKALQERAEYKKRSECLKRLQEMWS